MYLSLSLPRLKVLSKVIEDSPPRALKRRKASSITHPSANTITHPCWFGRFKNIFWVYWWPWNIEIEPGECKSITTCKSVASHWNQERCEYRQRERKKERKKQRKREKRKKERGSKQKTQQPRLAFSRIAHLEKGRTCGRYISIVLFLQSVSCGFMAPPGGLSTPRAPKELLQKRTNVIWSRNKRSGHGFAPCFACATYISDGFRMHVGP